MRAVLTSLDVTTKRGCPAEFDRGHDAAFHAAKMAVMRLGVGRAVAAEDVRHLQSGSHGPAQAGGTTSNFR